MHRRAALVGPGPRFPRRHRGSPIRGFVGTLYAGGRVPRAEREKVVQEMVERYAAYLERACLRTPFQWFNFFDYWA